MDIQPILDLIAQHKWVGVAALVIGLLVRMMKEDTSFPPFAIPSRWRPYLALGLGIASGVLQAVSTGTPWKTALTGGLVSGVVAIVGHDTVIAGLLNGKEIRIPGLTKDPPSATPPHASGSAAPGSPPPLA